jgi:osmotically-inducible protein OsmY
MDEDWKMIQMLGCLKGIDVDDLAITVGNDSVVVSGRVDSLWKKRVLESRITVDDGPDTVKSNLHVALEKDIDDPVIGASIRNGLTAIGGDLLRCIKVRVWNARVRLTGVVGDFQTRLAADEVASRVPGVVDVENDLIVL